MVFRGHEEVGRLGRMMGGLFGDVIASSVVGIVPIAGKGLSENGVQGLFDAAADTVSILFCSHSGNVLLPYGGLICQPLR